MDVSKELKARMASRNDPRLLTEFLDPTTDDLKKVSPELVAQLVSGLTSKQYRKSNISWGLEVAARISKLEQAPIEARIDAAEVLGNAQYLRTEYETQTDPSLKDRALRSLVRVCPEWAIENHPEMVKTWSKLGATAWNHVRNSCTTLEEAAAYLEDPDPKSMGAAARRYATQRAHAADSTRWLLFLAEKGVPKGVDLPLTVGLLQRLPVSCLPLEARGGRAGLCVLSTEYLREELHNYPIFSLPRWRVVEAMTQKGVDRLASCRNFTVDEVIELASMVKEAGLRLPHVDVVLHTDKDVAWALSSGFRASWVPAASIMASLSPDVELLKLHWYSMEADLTEERYHGMRLDLGKLYARSPWARNTLAMTFSNPEGDVDRIPQLLESATGEVFSALADVLCVRRDRSVPTQLHAAGTSLLVRPCAWQAFRPGAEVVVETILRNNPNVDLSELVENGGLDVRVAGRSAYLFELLRDKGVLDLATAVSSAEGATTDWLHSQGVDTTERWNAVFALLEADVTVPLKEVPALALSMA